MATADRGDVLQVQRMLTASSGRGARSAVFAGVVALVLAGCSTNEDSRVAPPTEASTSGLDVSPTLDRESGAIVFPGDRFDVTNAEAVLLAAASGYVVKDCINDHGISFSPPVDAWDPLYDVSSYFGVWTVPVAERFGFVSPMTSADMRANDVMVDGEPVPESSEPPAAWRSNDLGSEEAQAVIAACSSADGAARFDQLALTAGPWQADLDSAFDAARQTQEWDDAVDEYRGCLSDKGIAPDPDDELAVVGQDLYAIDAEQISLALEVVGCKDDVMLVDRLAGLVSAFQAPVIDEYATDLVAYRASVDAVVAEARALLADHGVSL
ncbi:hypothetical protein [Sanguibacter sp. Leaf3]|uniref:hypothetical protein n=1 Tax=Sanguibacter sp. Leaf3 TaxID=1736209 RepID=UPI00138F54DB|nr:hypothetical protein [Sanguibacter sp. Leaf3]